MEKLPHSIPEELIKELDAANHRFSEAKGHLEQEIDSTADQHQERIDRKSEELRAAEKELEEVTRKIEEALRGEG